MTEKNNPYTLIAITVDGMLYSYKYGIVWVPEGKEAQLPQKSSDPPGGLRRVYYPPLPKYKDAQVKLWRLVPDSIESVERYLHTRERHPGLINHMDDHNPYGIGPHHILQSESWELLPIRYWLGPPEDPEAGNWHMVWDTEERFQQYPDRREILRCHPRRVAPTRGAPTAKAG